MRTALASPAPASLAHAALAIALAPAEPAPASSAPDDRATTFQAVEGGQETHSGSTLMVEAYAVIWVILMAFLAMLWRRQASVNARLDDLERVIEKADAAAARDGQR